MSHLVTLTFLEPDTIAIENRIMSLLRCGTWTLSCPYVFQMRWSYVSPPRRFLYLPGFISSQTPSASFDIPKTGALPKAVIDLTEPADKRASRVKAGISQCRRHGAIPRPRENSRRNAHCCLARIHSAIPPALEHRLKPRSCNVHCRPTECSQA